MHLVSRQRYPLMHMLPTEMVVEYLISAPKVVRDFQPMHWTFLDGPPDGSVFLTWQPSHHMGNNFSSDGYIWADVEQAFTFEARGFTVEMYLHRSGYHPPNEAAAIHCRRRYHLISSKGVQVDPSLWIVHYSRAPIMDHVPANRIPILPPVQNMLAQRRFLQSHGQLARKEFMLYDRSSWPTISFPPAVSSQAFAQPPVPSYAANPLAAGRHHPYAQAAAVSPGVAGVPPAAAVAATAKVPRGHRSSTAAMQAMAAEFAIEDEDVSAGDTMDLLTPRDVSKLRYKQHHEWMEEIFASPYAMSQIVPVSLGLGRKGELETLTAGFFDAPPTRDTQDQDAPDATKMERGRAEEFADRVSKKVANMKAEIEKLKKQHAQRMNRFNRTSFLKEAELRLRDSATDPAETGPEIWRLEGRIFVPEDGGNPQLEQYKVDDVVKEVESATKKKIAPEPKISCVQKGGLLEKIDRPVEQEDQFVTAESGPQTADVDVDMDDAVPSSNNTAAGETGDWVLVNNNQDQGTSAAPKEPSDGKNTTSNPGNAAGLESSGGGGNNFDLSNMDTAGDALAAYTEQNDGLELGDMDSSAFGDAFHAAENENRDEPSEMS